MDRYGRVARQFMTFAACGAVGTLAQYAVLVALVSGFGVGSVRASSAGFVLGAVINYALNYRYTFASSGPHLATGTKFMIVALLGLGLNAAIMAGLTHGIALHYFASQLLATAVVLGWNFLANRIWTFKR
ncbi:MAG: GtrA family protein [Gammaproteobacteria bacterium]|nr:GtrA family protein [Gammaproteobacteria bacterium]